MSAGSAFSLDRYEAKGFFDRDAISDMLRYKLKAGQAARDGSPEEVIVRNIMKRGADEDKRIQREVDLLKFIEEEQSGEEGKEFIIRHFGFREDHAYFTLISEMCEEKLKTVVGKARGGRGLGLEDVRHLGRQLATGIKYLHTMNIVHRGINSDVIFIDFPNGRTDIRDARLKISGFGNSRLNDSEGSMTVLTAKPGNVTEEQFQAPELHRLKSEGKKRATYDGKSADVFSGGCVVFHMATGSLPFGTADLQKPEAPDVEDVAEDLGVKDQKLLGLLDQALAWNPQNRLSASTLAHHRFFRKGKEEGSLPNQRKREDLKKVCATHKFFGLPAMKDVYPISAQVRGQALIINNHNFKDSCHENREGSQLDVEKLETLFSELSFNVTVRKDLTWINFQEALDDFCSLNAHAAGQMSVVVIMSHGDECSFIATDGIPIDVERILERFTSGSCPLLDGKPKLFFFQKCSGHLRDRSPLPSPRTQDNRTHSDAIPLTAEEKIAPPRPPLNRDSSNRTRVDAAPLSKEEGAVAQVPPPNPLGHAWADMAIGYSTIDGYVSYRDTSMGSWYIESLYNVFSEYACEKSLNEMMHMVAGNLASYKSSTGERQSCQYMERSMVKKLYFNPGIYLE